MTYLVGFASKEEMRKGDALFRQAKLEGVATQARALCVLQVTSAWDSRARVEELLQHLDCRLLDGDRDI